MQPQGDSIWGNINLCIEIALNIYYLCGEKGEGIVIPKEQAEKDFSPETVAAGKESDGYLYYPKGEAMEMFRHEMLQKRLVMIKKMELAATEQFIRNYTGKHGADNTTNRTNGNNETGIQSGISFLCFQIKNSPTVYRISADIHKCT